MSEDIRRQYQAPSFARHDLRVVTLGGSPGTGDSGDPTNQGPITGSTGSRYEEFEEGESFNEGDF